MNGVLGMTEMLLGTDADRDAAQLHRAGQAVRRAPAGDHQRHPGLFQDRGRQADVEYINFNLCDLLDDIDTVYTPQAAGQGHRAATSTSPTTSRWPSAATRTGCARSWPTCWATPSSSPNAAHPGQGRVASEDSAGGRAALRSARHRHRRLARGAQPHLRGVLAGRRLHHAQVRRHGAGPGDLQAAGGTDGRRDRRRQRAAPGLGVLVHGQLRQAPRRSGRARRTAADPRRPARAAGRRATRPAARAGAPPGGLARRMRLRASRRRGAGAPAPRPRAAASPTTRPSSTWNCGTPAACCWRPASRPIRPRAPRAWCCSAPTELAADPVQRREAGVAYQLIKPAARGRPVRLPRDAPAPRMAGGAAAARAARPAAPRQHDAGARTPPPRAPRAAGRGQSGQRRGGEGHAGEPGPAGALRAQRRRKRWRPCAPAASTAC